MQKKKGKNGDLFFLSLCYYIGGPLGFVLYMKYGDPYKAGSTQYIQFPFLSSPNMLEINKLPQGGGGGGGSIDQRIYGKSSDACQALK